MTQIVSRLTQQCVKWMQKDVKICETPMNYLSDTAASQRKAKELFGKKASFLLNRPIWLASRRTTRSAISSRTARPGLGWQPLRA